MRAADWIIPAAGLARVQCPHPMAIRSLATPATVGIYVTAVRLIRVSYAVSSSRLLVRHDRSGEVYQLHRATPQ